jgi:hypothetical protein
MAMDYAGPGQMRRAAPTHALLRFDEAEGGTSGGQGRACAVEETAPSKHPALERRVGATPMTNGAGISGHRHGSRTRMLTGTFGKTEITVPRARLRKERTETCDFREVWLSSGSRQA